MSANTILILSLALSAAPHAPTKTEPMSTRAIYDYSVRASAFVESKHKNSTGTAWIVDHNRRLLVTNYHVAPEGDCVIYFPRFVNGKIVSEARNYFLTGVSGKVIDSDPKLDLSIIEVSKIPDGMHALRLASEEPSPGDKLFSVGNPGAGHGLFVFTTGTVRQLTTSQIRFRDGQFIQARFIEAQVPINPGDSGSASLNEFGQVVGVNFAIPSTADVRGFAWIIAASEVRGFVKDVVELKGEQTQAATFERRAIRLVRKNKVELALADLHRAIELDPKRPSAYRQRASLYRVMKNYDAALMDGYRHVELAPNDFHARNERGHSFYFRGDYKRAAAEYTKAVELAPTESVLWTNRGRIYSRLKDRDRAMKDFAKAIELNSFNLEAFRERGQLHLKHRDHKLASADFEAGLKLAPQDGDLLANLGRSRQGENRHADAIDLFGKALQVGVENAAPIWAKVAESRLALNQADLAFGAAEQAVKLAPGNANAWLLRGKALEAKGEVDDAQADFQKAVELDRRLETSLPRFSTRQVKIRNTTGESIEVFVQYDRTLANGTDTRLPAKGWVRFTIGTGGTTTLLDENNRPIQTRKLRIWAVGTKSGKRHDMMKHRDIVLVDGSYRATKIDAHVHGFGE